MIDFLIGLGGAVLVVWLYLLVGFWHARRQAVRSYSQQLVEQRRRYASLPEHRIEELALQQVGYGTASRVIGWPFEMLAGLGTGLGNLGRNVVMAPVYERQRRAEKLRADIRHWQSVVDDEVNDEKKAMAEELVRVLTEQLKEADR